MQSIEARLGFQYDFEDGGSFEGDFKGGEGLGEYLH